MNQIKFSLNDGFLEVNSLFEFESIFKFQFDFFEGWGMGQNLLSSSRVEAVSVRLKFKIFFFQASFKINEIIREY